MLYSDRDGRYGKIYHWKRYAEESQRIAEVVSSLGILGSPLLRQPGSDQYLVLEHFAVSALLSARRCCGTPNSVFLVFYSRPRIGEGHSRGAL